MLGRLFETPERSARDAQEVLSLRGRYGKKLLPELRSRIGNSSPGSRDRKHWQRILRKARRFG